MWGESPSLAHPVPETMLLLRSICANNALVLEVRVATGDKNGNLERSPRRHDVRDDTELRNGHDSHVPRRHRELSSSVRSRCASRGFGSHCSCWVTSEHLSFVAGGGSCTASRSTPRASTMVSRWIPTQSIGGRGANRVVMSGWGQFLPFPAERPPDTGAQECIAADRCSRYSFRSQHQHNWSPREATGPARCS